MAGRVREGEGQEGENGIEGCRREGGEGGCVEGPPREGGELNARLKRWLHEYSELMR